MKKIAVIIYGPPGAGKGTQADLLAKALNLVHFDIGSYLEQIVHDPANRKNKKIQEERHNFDSGILCDPFWVAKLAAERIRTIARAGLSLILSGSLRTINETFGKQGLLHVVEEEYGKKNIFFFLLKVRPESSIKRNSSRFICKVCGRPTLTQYLVGKPKACPVCGGPLRRRTLDKPAVIKVRIREFNERTAPIFRELKKHGHIVRPVNGELAPYKVHQEIMRCLK